MAEFAGLNDEAQKRAGELTELVRQKAWSEHSRQGIVAVLEQSLEKLEALKSLLEKIQKGLGAEEGAGIKEHLLEMEKQLAVLKRNLEFERSKKSSQDDLLKQGEPKEQYAALEQIVQALLLRTRYILERVQLRANKQLLLPGQEKSTARNLIDLLERKESEIQELKQKYSDARKRALTGVSELADSATVEQEMNMLARKLEVQQNDLEKAYFESRKSMEAMQRSNMVLRKEVMSLQQLFANYFSKNFELITLLKKERDFAKKIVMDIEHETLQLRSAYSRELLSLEEAKVAAKREAEERFLGRLKKLERECEQKQQLTGQLQGMLQDREKKLSEIEEKNRTLRLLLKTKKKHDAVKKAFTGKR